MATITGFTSARMLQIENTTVVSGSIIGDDLVLEMRNGTPVNAGNVRGPRGLPGGNAGYAESPDGNQVLPGGVSETMVFLNNLSITWVADPLKLYRVSCRFQINSPETGTMMTHLTDGNADPYAAEYFFGDRTGGLETPTIIDPWWFTKDLSGSVTRKIAVYWTGSSSCTVVNGLALTGFGTARTRSMMMVEDMGNS